MVLGIDPPDQIKPVPCAKLECWIDPFSLPPIKALDAIGRTLQLQYEVWQPRAKYRLSLDPRCYLFPINTDILFSIFYSIEDVKKLCCSLRRNSKDERILFHYGGHGVPKPTVGGEIWYFFAISCNNPFSITSFTGSSTRITHSTFPCPFLMSKPGLVLPVYLYMTAQTRAIFCMPSTSLQRNEIGVLRVRLPKREILPLLLLLWERYAYSSLCLLTPDHCYPNEGMHPIGRVRGE